ncbi:Mo-dependent nitrogenase C-terminal domain-containing protein [Leptolyngbya sp. AN02str]|uniref:Mo-dependent nitrogenase C-terminal domain-containing protein n=1 Tax=Leptolyngbya sp. AN02str TaxID=3423363 RepID=UPI003D320B5E
MNNISSLHQPHNTSSDLLKPIRKWLNHINVCDRTKAHTIAKFIPAQCPFERDIVLFGRTVAHIPPLCKLNPFYDEFVSLRFRSLCYLADECGEDISSYI